MIVQEMDRLVKNHFQHVEQSCFIEPLKQMFLPTGKIFRCCRAKSNATL